MNQVFPQESDIIAVEQAFFAVCNLKETYGKQSKCLALFLAYQELAQAYRQLKSPSQTGLSFAKALKVAPPDKIHEFVKKLFLHSEQAEEASYFIPKALHYLEKNKLGCDPTLLQDLAHISHRHKIDEACARCLLPLDHERIAAWHAEAGKIHAKAQELHEAIDYYQKASFHFSQAGDFAKAAKNYAKNCEENPNYCETTYIGLVEQAAEQLNRLGRYREASDFFAIAAQHYEKTSNWLLAVEHCEKTAASKAASQNEQEEYKWAFRAAGNYFRAGLLLKALQCSKETLQLRSENFHLLSYRGEYSKCLALIENCLDQLEVGAPPQSEQESQAATDLLFSMAETLQQESLHLLAGKTYELEAKWSHTPQVTAYLLQQACNQFQQVGYVERIKRCAKQAIELYRQTNSFSNAAVLYELLAHSYKGREKLKKAAENYILAAELIQDDDQAAGFYASALCCYESGGYTEGILYSLTAAAACYRRQANYAEAAKQFQSAAKQGDASCWIQAAECYAMDGNHEKAVFCYKQATQKSAGPFIALLEQSLRDSGKLQEKEGFATLAHCCQNIQEPELEAHFWNETALLCVTKKEFWQAGEAFTYAGRAYLAGKRAEEAALAYAQGSDAYLQDNDYYLYDAALSSHEAAKLFAAFDPPKHTEAAGYFARTAVLSTPVSLELLEKAISHANESDKPLSFLSYLDPSFPHLDPTYPQISPKDPELMAFLKRVAELFLQAGHFEQARDLYANILICHNASLSREEEQTFHRKMEEVSTQCASGKKRLQELIVSAHAWGEAASQSEEAARIYICAGKWSLLSGDENQAAADLSCAVKKYEHANDPLSALAVCEELASLYVRLRQFFKAGETWQTIGALHRFFKLEEKAISDFVESANYFRQANLLDSAASSYCMAAQSSLALDPPNRKGAAQYYEEAAKLLKGLDGAGCFHNAKEQYEHLQDREAAARCLQQISWRYCEKNLFVDSARIYRQIPIHSTVYKGYIHLGLLEQAVNWLKQKQDPLLCDYLQEIAELYDRLGDERKAAPYYEEAGILLWQSGYDETAIECLEKAQNRFEAQEDKNRCFDQLAALQNRCERAHLAIFWYNRLPPSCTQYHLNQHIYYLKCAALEGEGKRDSSFPDFYKQIADLYSHHQNYESALYYYQRYATSQMDVLREILKQPNQQETFQKYMIKLIQSGQFEVAKKHLLKSYFKGASSNEYKNVLLNCSADKMQDWLQQHPNEIGKISEIISILIRQVREAKVLTTTLDGLREILKEPGRHEAFAAHMDELARNGQFDSAIAILKSGSFAESTRAQIASLFVNCDPQKLNPWLPNHAHRKEIDAVLEILRTQIREAQDRLF